MQLPSQDSVLQELMVASGMSLENWTPRTKKSSKKNSLDGASSSTISPGSTSAATSSALSSPAVVSPVALERGHMAPAAVHEASSSEASLVTLAVRRMELQELCLGLRDLF